MNSCLSYLVITLYMLTASAFSLYPSFDPKSLATTFGISSTCLEALNSTINCDNDLMAWTVDVDSYLWFGDNLTTLCDEDCMGSASNWYNEVQVSCANDTLQIGGMLVPAETVVGRYNEGLGLACTQNSSSSWCLLESQDWIGSDVIQPDCTSPNATDPSCVDPSVVSPENQRIANLYNDTLLCSECFLYLFYQRISSTFLPDSDHSDYLIDQYMDILDICEDYSLPNLTIRALPSYAPAPMSTAPSSTPIGSSNGTCWGQTLEATGASSSCDQISQSLGVSTGDLQAFSNSDNCTLTTSICLPPACSLQRVPVNSSCELLASQFSTSNFTVTSFMFQTWNPNMIGLCDSPLEGQYVCAGAPGGTYVLPPAILGNATGNSQQRGGQGSGNTTTAPTSTSIQPSAITIMSGVPVPSPTQSGISSSCNMYAEAVTGDYCSKFAQDYNISIADLYAWNTVLGSGGNNCNTELFANYYYCTGIST